MSMKEAFETFFEEMTQNNLKKRVCHLKHHVMKKNFPQDCFCLKL